MDTNRISGVTLQQIEVFLSAAKYENFTKASNELHMTQASVSRNIAALELALGLVLFVRHNHRVRLTPAGKLLLDGMKGVVNQLEATLDKAYEAQQCQYNTLRIGDYNTTPGSAYLLPILKAFEAENPDVEVSVVRADPLGVRDGLMEGQFDAVFFSVAGRDSFREMNMEFVQIFNLAPCIVLSRGHRLFDQEDALLSDFCHDVVVTMATGGYSVYWQYARAVLEQNGFDLRRVKYVDNPHTIATELQRGSCIALMDQLYVPIDRSDLRYIRIPNCEKGLGFGIAYDPENLNIHLKKFISCAKSLHLPV